MNHSVQNNCKKKKIMKRIFEKHPRRNECSHVVENVKIGNLGVLLPEEKGDCFEKFRQF